VAVLVMAAALGWYGYSQHNTRLAPHLAAGKRWLATGQYDLARQAYQRVLAQSWFGTREGQLGLKRASIFDAADGAYHPEVIQQRIEHLRQQHPNDPYADLFEGDLYAVQEQPDDYAKAQTLYERAVAHDPTLAHGYFRLGVVYDKLGQPQQALAMYDRAVHLVPWYQPYLHNLAYQYVRL
jgi:tetratricopeptide (TPR) repeat protein